MRKSQYKPPLRKGLTPLRVKRQRRTQRPKSLWLYYDLWWLCKKAGSRDRLRNPQSAVYQDSLVLFYPLQYNYCDHNYLPVALLLRYLSISRHLVANTFYVKSTAKSKYRVDFTDRDGQLFSLKKILIPKKVFSSTKRPNFFNFSTKEGHP